jgi:hypothetical protein
MSTVLPPVTGGILSDIIIWIRRLLKSPSSASISDNVIADYINRFWSYDVAERIQLLELKRQYTFETAPNIFEYQAPYVPALSNRFPGDTIPAAPPFIGNPPAQLQQAQTLMPVYQNFRPPIYCDGVQIGWFQSNDQFYKVFPELVLNEFPLQGNGTNGPYQILFGRQPVLRGFIDDLGNLLPYVYITALDSSGNQHYIVDSGYTTPTGLGILIETDSTFQNIVGNLMTGNPPNGGGAGTVDYINGIANFSFGSTMIPAGINIESQTSPYSSGIPRVCLFYNNIFKLYPVPDRAYKIQMDAYITPIVFFNTQASMPFAYMSEYIARGAARKILSDMGDYDQFQFYEPLFREQENLVLRRSDRQRAVESTPTIFSAQMSNNPFIYSQY